MNIVAKKTRTSGKFVIDTVKTYNKKSKEYEYFQSITRYVNETGGEAETGDWYSINEKDYIAEDGAEITYQ
jgi:hypothetical protein